MRNRGGTLLEDQKEQKKVQKELPLLEKELEVSDEHLFLKLEWLYSGKNSEFFFCTVANNF